MRVLAALLSLLPLATTLQAQDQRGGDPRKALDSYERYLERKPYHDWGFTKLVETAVSLNELDELVDRWEARLAASPDDTAARVVLGRLYARTLEFDAAIETLSQIPEETALLGLLMGSLYLERNNTEEAITALDRAVTLTQDREELEQIHDLRGEAFLARGNREEATAAFHAIAELEPESFHLRLEAASKLAFNGLFEEAIEDFDVAQELAGEDTARRCRVLSEIGRLHEALAQGEEALQVYREAIGLMARGNWLKRDIYERVLALHSRTGQLEKLLDIARAEAEASSGDLDAQEFHARVLSEMQRHVEAQEVLAAAVERHPADLALSRELVASLKATADTDAMIAEYQRILVEQPGELELYLELGQLFAAEGRFEQAQRQWQRTLDERLQDASLAVRLAGMYALYDRVDEAVDMFETAIRIEPGEIRHYSDLAKLLSVRDRSDEIPELLERAGQVAAGSTGRLEEVSGLWLEHGHPARALETLEQAVAGNPEDPHLLHRLADLLISSEQDVDRGVEILHKVVALTTEANLRQTAVDRIVRTYRRGGRLEELRQKEEARIAAEPDALASRFILGALFVRRQMPGEAIAQYETLLEVESARVEALTAIAKQLERMGYIDEALARYEELIEVRPQLRPTVLKSIARIHLARSDQDKALACYDEILAGAPDNASVFRRVAKAYEALGMMEKRAECLRQAIRLEPDEGRTRLDLADTYLDLGEVELSERELLAAITVENEQTRAKAREKYYRMLASGARVPEEIKNLRRRIDENPYDLEAPLSLTDIYVRELEYELALELLDRLITYQPTEQSLTRERARIFSLMDRHEEAASDLERLYQMEGVNQESIALDLAAAALELDDRERASQVLAQVSDPRKVASVYEKDESWPDAVAVLEQGLARTPGNRELLKALAGIHEKSGDQAAAILALERLADTQGNTWRNLKELCRLYDAADRSEDFIRVGSALLDLVGDFEERERALEASGSSLSGGMKTSSSAGRSRAVDRIREVRNLFSSANLSKEFRDIGYEQVMRQPASYDMFTVVFSALVSEADEGARAQEIIEAVRSATLVEDRIPPGFIRSTWERYLESAWVRPYSRDVGLANGRITALEERGLAELSLNELLELATLYSGQNEHSKGIDVLIAAVDRFPLEPNPRAGLAALLDGQKLYEDAIPHYEELDRILHASPPDVSSEREFRREWAFKTRKQSILNGFPLHVRQKVTDEEVRRYLALSESPNYRLAWGRGTVQHPEAARFALVRCLGQADRVDEAVPYLESLVAASSGSLSELTQLARLYEGLELDSDAAVLLQKIRTLEGELSADPILGHNRSWERRFTQPLAKLARIMEKQGEYLEAYDLLRSSGDPAAGKLLLKTHDLFEKAEGFYSARVEAARAAMQSSGETATWRDASVRLAEVRQFALDYDKALATYEQIVSQVPHDFAVLEAIAALHERAGRYEQAVATHELAIDRKRAWNRTPMRADAPPGRTLTPTLPTPSTDTFYAWNAMRSWNPAPSGARVTYRGNYVSILKIHLDQGRVAKAVEVIRDLSRVDAQVYQWMGYYLGQVIMEYRFGVEALPLMRILAEQGTVKNEEMHIHYGKLLIQVGKPDEARRVLERVMQRHTSGYYYYDMAERAITELNSREGLADAKTEADLVQAIEANSKSVAARTELAKYLLEAGTFQEALEQARVAAELAPHRSEVQDLLRDCLQVCGLQDELEIELMETLSSSKETEELMAAAGQLATWARWRGDEQRVTELFEGLLEDRPKALEGIAAWYLMEGERGRAIELLGRNADKKPGSNENLETLLRDLQLAEGDPFPALDEAWKATIVSGRTAGDKAQVLQRLGLHLVEYLALFSNRAELHAQIDAGYEGFQAVLYHAALDLAARDYESCEARLKEAVSMEEDARFLTPILVRLARNRDDPVEALRWLEELERNRGASESSLVRLRLGAMSERDLLRAEMGSLYLEMGDREKARSIWAEIEDVNANSRIKVSLHSSHGLIDEAVQLQRKRIEDLPNQSSSEWILLAELETERENYPAAIESLETAAVLETQAWSLQTINFKLLEAYQRAGRLDQYLAATEEVVAADPDDVDAQKRLARILVYLDREQEALEVLGGLLEKPDMTALVGSILFQHAIRQGEMDEAIALGEILVRSRMSEYELAEITGPLSRILLSRDEVERAIEVVRQGNLDLEGIECEIAIADALERAGYHDRAIEFYNAALDIGAPEQYGTSRALSALRRLGRHGEIRDFLISLAGNPKLLGTGLEHISSFYDQTLVRTTGESERVAKALSEDPGDLFTNHLAALICLMEDDLDGALARYDSALSTSPENLFTLNQKLNCLVEAERHREALAVLDSMQPIVDRLSGVDGLRTPISREALKRKRAELLFRIEGKDSAATSLTESRGNTYAPLAQLELSSARSGPDPDRIAFHRNRKDWEEVMDLYRERPLIGSTSPQFRHRDAAALYEARFHSGQAEQVLSELWDKVVGNPLLDDGGSSRSLFIRTVRNTGSDNPKATLYRLHAERGTLDELLAQIDAVLSERPKDSNLIDFKKVVLEGMQGWPGLALLLEEETEELGPNPERDLELGRIYRRIGEDEKARTVLERSHSNFKYGEFDEAMGWYGSRYERNSMPQPPIRFSFATSSNRYLSGGGWTSYGTISSMGGPRADARRELAALYLEIGLDEEALLLEEQEYALIAQERIASNRGVSNALGEVYLRHGLYEDARRVLARYHESEVAALQEPPGERRDRKLEELELRRIDDEIRIILESGQLGGLEALVAERLEAHDRALERSNTDGLATRNRRASTVYAKAALLARLPGTQEEVREMLESIPTILGKEPSASTTSAFTWYRIGDTERARAQFEELRDGNLWSTRNSSSVNLGLGLCLYDLGETEEALALLRQVFPTDHDADLRNRVNQILGRSR